MAEFQKINGCNSMVFMKNNYNFAQIPNKEVLREMVKIELINRGERIKRTIYGVAFVTNEAPNILSRIFTLAPLGVSVLSTPYRKGIYDAAYLGQIKLCRPIATAEVNIHIKDTVAEAPVQEGGNYACQVECENKAQQVEENQEVLIDAHEQEAALKE